MRGISAALCIALALLSGGVAVGLGATSPREERVFYVVLRPSDHGNGYAAIEVRPHVGVATLIASREAGRRNDQRVRAAAYAVRIPTAAGEVGPLDASFGEAGSIAGEVAIGPGDREPAFSGSIKLRMPGGLFQADTDHAEIVRTKRPPSEDPSNLFTYLPHAGGFSNYDDPILFARTERPHRLVELTATRDCGLNPAHLARFVAADFEPEPGEVATARWVEVSGVASSTFSTPSSKRPTSATLMPPEPFSGTARWSQATDSLRGNLTVALPGLEVGLAGMDSRARLCDYFTVARHPCR